jgi:hypothetical protein
VSRNYPVDFLDDSAFDSVEALPDPHCDIAWDLLDHLRTHPRFGKPLEHSTATGDLSDSRSLYVIDLDQRLLEWPPPYRIVYRLLPSEANVERVQVIWAGPRDDLRVYRAAARRLGRL